MKQKRIFSSTFTFFWRPNLTYCSYQFDDFIISCNGFFCFINNWFDSIFSETWELCTSYKTHSCYWNPCICFLNVKHKVTNKNAWSYMHSYKLVAMMCMNKNGWFYLFLQPNPQRIDFVLFWDWHLRHSLAKAAQYFHYLIKKKTPINIWTWIIWFLIELVETSYFDGKKCIILNYYKKI